MASSIYRQLTGKRRRAHLFTQLFLGPDHLLLVRSNRFEERYQRFYFKDIQALVVTGIPSRVWLQASLGLLAGVIFLIALTIIANPAWRGLLGILGVFPGVIAIADYIRGERCGMILKTAVSNEPLPPVSRMSIARLVISRLKSAIEQTQQGEWTSDMEPFSGPAVMAPPPPVQAPANRLLAAAFGLVTLDAVIYVIARLSRRNEVLIMLVYTVFTEIVLAVAALSRRGDDRRWILLSLCGVIAVCATLDILGGLGLFGFFIWLNSEDQRHGTTLSPRLLQLDYPRAMLWWGFGWRAVVAAAGWVTYFFKIEAATDNRPAAGGSPFLQ